MPKPDPRPPAHERDRAPEKSEPAIKVRQVEIPRDVQIAISRSLELGRAITKKR